MLLVSKCTCTDIVLLLNIEQDIFAAWWPRLNLVLVIFAGNLKVDGWGRCANEH